MAVAADMPPISATYVATGVRDIGNRVISVLRNESTPQHIGELLGKLNVSEDTSQALRVREAVWQLLADHDLELTKDFKLKVPVP